MNRRQAREEAFKMLFEYEVNEPQADIEFKDADSYIREIISGVLKKLEEVDHAIAQQLENWTFDRIAPIEKAILRISVYEILFMADIPSAVSINEAVELAHKYGDEKSSKFINGILSKVHK